MQVWLNGHFVPPEEATVPILSHAVGRGSAIFEVADVVQGATGAAMFRMDAHVDRLLNSARAMGMELRWTRGELIDAVRQTIRVNQVSCGAVKLLAFFAAPEFGLIPADATVHLAVFCFDLHRLMGKKVWSPFEPVTAGVSRFCRISSSAVVIQAKVAGHYVNAYHAKRDVLARGFDEAILLDERGLVCEGPLSNLFLVKDGVILTSTLANALAGITRDSTMQVIRAAGLPVREVDLPAGDLARVDEAFFTGTIVRARAVKAIDGRPLACPGPVTVTVQNALNDAYEGRNPAFRHWLAEV